MNALIAGVGESPLGSVPGMNALDLQRAAALAALEDAGLSLADVDGLLTTPIRVAQWAMPVGMVAQGLGIRPGYLATLDVAGASGTALAHHAAMAVATGQADTVLCVAGQNQLSNVSRDATVQQLASVGWAHPEYEAPYGPLIPTLYALVAQRHMHEYGTTPEQMAEVAVAIRGHAALNPVAYKRQPVTAADVLGSRMITSPLRLLDCAIVTDGAAAYVVTTAERARDLKKRGVRLLGQGYGFTHAYIGEHDHIATTGAVQSGREAFAMAGVEHADIDCAQLYDCFTITVLAELEDLGFCPKGEGGRFVEGGRIRLGGELPVTTHGGLLSAVHPGLAGGMFHVVEAVRQLRGECGARQVPDAELVLAHGNGGIIGIHCTLILGEGLMLPPRPLDRFVLPRCEDCGRFHFYPRPVCPHCQGARIAWAEASGGGSVYSHSTVHRAPSPAFKADVPYVVAIVKTDEGPHLLSRVVGVAPEAVKIGMRLKVRAADGELPVFAPE